MARPFVQTLPPFSAGSLEAVEASLAGEPPMWSEPMAILGEFSHISGPAVIFTFACLGEKLRSATVSLGGKKKRPLTPPSRVARKIYSGENDHDGLICGGRRTRSNSFSTGASPQLISSTSPASLTNGAYRGLRGSTSSQRETVFPTAAGVGHFPQVPTQRRSPRRRGKQMSALENAHSGADVLRSLVSIQTHTDAIYRVASIKSTGSTASVGASRQPPPNQTRSWSAQRSGLLLNEGQGSSFLQTEKEREESRPSGRTFPVVTVASALADSPATTSLLEALSTHADFHSRSMTRPLRTLASTDVCSPFAIHLPRVSSVLDWCPPSQTVASTMPYSMTNPHQLQLQHGASTPTAATAATVGGRHHNTDGAGGPIVGGAFTRTQLVCSDMLLGRNVVSGSTVRKKDSSALLGVVQRATNSGCADAISIFTDPIVGGIASLSFNLFDVEARGEKRPMQIIVTHPDPRELLSRMSVLGPYMTAIVVDIVAKSDQIRQAENANGGARSSEQKKRESNQRELRVTGFAGLLRTLHRELHDFFDIVLPVTLSVDASGILNTLLTKSKLQQEKREAKRLRIASELKAQRLQGTDGGGDEKGENRQVGEFTNSSSKYLEGAQRTPSSLTAYYTGNNYNNNNGSGSSSGIHNAQQCLHHTQRSSSRRGSFIGIRSSNSHLMGNETGLNSCNAGGELPSDSNSSGANKIDSVTLAENATPLCQHCLAQLAVSNVINPPFVARTDPQVFKTSPVVFIDTSSLAPPEEEMVVRGGVAATAAMSLMSPAGTAVNGDGSASAFSSSRGDTASHQLHRSSASAVPTSGIISLLSPQQQQQQREGAPIPRPPLEEQDLFVESLQAEMDMLPHSTAVTFQLTAPQRVYPSVVPTSPPPPALPTSVVPATATSHNPTLSLTPPEGASEEAKNEQIVTVKENAGPVAPTGDVGDTEAVAEPCASGETVGPLAAKSNSKVANPITEKEGINNNPLSPLPRQRSDSQSARHLLTNQQQQQQPCITLHSPSSASMCSTRRGSMTSVAPLLPPQCVLPVMSDVVVFGFVSHSLQGEGGGGIGRLGAAIAFPGGGGSGAFGSASYFACELKAESIRSILTAFRSFELSSQKMSRAFYNCFPCANQPPPKPLPIDPRVYTPMHLLHREQRTKCVVLEVEVPRAAAETSEGSLSLASTTASLLHGECCGAGNHYAPPLVRSAATTSSNPLPPPCVRIPNPSNCVVVRSRAHGARIAPVIGVRPVSAWMLDAFWLLRENLYAFRTSFAPILTAVLSGGKVIVAGERADLAGQKRGGGGVVGADQQQFDGVSHVPLGAAVVTDVSSCAPAELQHLEETAASFALSLTNLLPQHLQKTQLYCTREDEIEGSAAKILSLGAEFMRENTIVQTSILSSSKQYVLSQLKPDGIVYVTVKPGHDVEYWSDEDGDVDEGDGDSDEGDSAHEGDERQPYPANGRTSREKLSSSSSSHRPPPPLVRFPPSVANVTNVDELYYRCNPQEAYAKKALNELAFATAWRHHAAVSRDLYPLMPSSTSYNNNSNNNQRMAHTARGDSSALLGAAAASASYHHARSHTAGVDRQAATSSTSTAVAAAVLTDAEFVAFSEWRRKAPPPSCFPFNTTKHPETREAQAPWQLRNSLEVMEAYGRRVYPTVVVEMIERTIQIGTLIEQSIKARQRRIYTAMRAEKAERRIREAEPKAWAKILREKVKELRDLVLSNLSLLSCSLSTPAAAVAVTASNATTRSGRASSIGGASFASPLNRESTDVFVANTEKDTTASSGGGSNSSGELKSVASGLNDDTHTDKEKEQPTHTKREEEEANGNNNHNDGQHDERRRSHMLPLLEALGLNSSACDLVLAELATPKRVDGGDCECEDRECADDDDDDDGALTLEEDIQMVQLSGVTDLSAMIDSSTEQCRRSELNTSRAYYDQHTLALKAKLKIAKEGLAREESDRNKAHEALLAELAAAKQKVLQLFQQQRSREEEDAKQKSSAKSAGVAGVGGGGKVVAAAARRQRNNNSNNTNNSAAVAEASTVSDDKKDMGAAAESANNTNLSKTDSGLTHNTIGQIVNSTLSNVNANPRAAGIATPLQLSSHVAAAAAAASHSITMSFPTSSSSPLNPSEFSPNEVFLLQLAFEGIVREGVSRGRMYLEIYTNLQCDLIAQLERGILPSAHNHNNNSEKKGGLSSTLVTSAAGPMMVGPLGVGSSLGMPSNNYAGDHHHYSSRSKRNGGGGGGGDYSSAFAPSGSSSRNHPHYTHTRQSSMFGGRDGNSHNYHPSHSSLGVRGGGGGGLHGDGGGGDGGGVADAASALSSLVPDGIGASSASACDGALSLVAASSAGGGGGANGGIQAFRNVSLLDAARVAEAFSNASHLSSASAGGGSGSYLDIGGLRGSYLGGVADGGSTSGKDGGGGRRGRDSKGKGLMALLEKLSGLFASDRGHNSGGGSKNSMGGEGAAGDGKNSTGKRGGGGSISPDTAAVVESASEKQQRGNGEGFEFIRREIQSNPKLRQMMKKWRYGIADDEVLCFLGSHPSPFS